MGTASGGTPTSVNQDSGIRDQESGLAPADFAGPRSTVPSSIPDRRARIPGSVEHRLFDEPFAFDFFQAVRLLQRLAPTRQPVGREGPPSDEVVRFRALLSLNFPPSSIYDLRPPGDDAAAINAGITTPVMTVAFL